LRQFLAVVGVDPSLKREPRHSFLFSPRNTFSSSTKALTSLNSR
jgi:hypothetical protein